VADGDRVVALRPKGDRPLRIALLAPPMVPVPPIEYGGTERIVAVLEEELTRRGHKVTTFAAGDSDVRGELVPTIEQSLWATGYRGDVTNYMVLSLARCWAEQERFDVVHSHAETLGFLFARYATTPVVTTLHGRLDVAGIPLLLNEFRDIPLVAISENQPRWWPRNNWRAVIHHGLPLESAPFSERPGNYLVLVGRMSPEKGIAEAIEFSRRADMPLKIAAKVYDPEEQVYFADVVKPALLTNPKLEFLGPLAPPERDALLASAYASLMLVTWPEPFGLAAIESLATGTPVIARKAGALPEIIEHGVDGFLVDDLSEAMHALSLVPTLSRRRIRERALERFSVERMVDEYEEVYRNLIAERAQPERDRVPRRRGRPRLAASVDRASARRPVDEQSASGRRSAAEQSRTGA
jgi:glycosyltransferase involved in cell wall biosynthesis